MSKYRFTSPRGISYEAEFDGTPTDEDLRNAQDFLATNEEDTQQPLLESTLMSVPRGAVSAAGSTVEGLGDVFGGDNFMHDAGREIKSLGNDAFTVNPAHEKTFAVKAGGVVGQVGEQVVETLTGAKLLGLAGIAGKTAVRTGIAVPSFLKGADAGEDVATQYGFTGMSKMASIYGAGAIEAGTELIGSKFLGGTNLEEALATKLISPGLARALGSSVKKDFIRGTVGEGIEEIEAGIANDLLTKSLITEDPNRPGYTTNGQPMPTGIVSGKYWGDRLEEFALGAIGGAMFAGPVALANRSKPRLAIDYLDETGAPQTALIPAGMEDTYAEFAKDGESNIRLASDTENEFADQVEAQQALVLGREKARTLEEKDSRTPEEDQLLSDLKSLDTTLTEWLGTKHAEEKINAAKIDDPADIDQAVASLQDARAIVTQGARAELTTDPALESQPTPEDFSEPPPPSPLGLGSHKLSSPLDLYHGGMSETATLDDVDLERLGTQQNKRGRSYGGFYLTDSSSVEWSKKYASDRGAALHRITLAEGSNVLYTNDNIDRLSSERRSELSKTYDAVRGKDTLGRSQWVLLNKNAVSQFDNVTEDFSEPPPPVEPTDVPPVEGMNQQPVAPNGQEEIRRKEEGRDALLSAPPETSTIPADGSASAPPAVGRVTRHRVFEGGSVVKVSGEGVLAANDTTKAYRLTGQPQIDDVLQSGEVRAKEGKMRGGRSGETQWSRGHEKLGYRAAGNEGNYVIVTPADGLNDRSGGLPVSSVERIYKSENGAWVDVTDSVKTPAAPAMANPGFAPTENAPRSQEEQQKLDALPSPEFTAAMDMAHQAGEKFTPVAELKPKVGDVITSAGKEFRVESVNADGTATIFNPTMGRNVVSDLPVQGHARIESSRVLRSGAKAGRLEPVVAKLKKVLSVDHVVVVPAHSDMNTALQEEATGEFADVDADGTVAPKGAYVQSSNHPSFKGQSVLYINKANATADTPIHELVGHQFAPWLKQNNFQLYSKGVELLKKNPRYLDAVKVTYFDEIEAARAKGGDQAAEDYLIEEAMATALGLNGQEIWRSTAESQTLIGQFVAWVKEMLAKFKDWATQNKLFGAEARRLWEENQGLQTGSIDAWSKSVNRTLVNRGEKKVEKLNNDLDANTAPLPKNDGKVAPTAEATGVPRAKNDAVSNDTGSPDVRQSKDAPATDADYMKAVESGDTEAAQRMVDAAAKAAGYATLAHHGTRDTRFTEFSHAKKGSSTESGDAKLGFFFATDERFANWFEHTREIVNPYAKTPTFKTNWSPRPGTIKVFLKLESPLKVRGSADSQREYKLQLAYSGGIPEGYDSMLTKVKNFHGKVVDELIVRSPNQIKSADPVTYDSDGKVIPLSQRFNAGSPDIRFSKDAPAFYSQAAEILMTKMPNQASVQQVKGLLAGAKADEVKWSGIIPWLDTQKDPVSRDAVIEFLQTDAAGKFKEVMMGGVTEGDKSRLKQIQNELNILQKKVDAGEITVQEGRAQFNALDVERVGLQKPETKYGEYQLPGGTNYRETVLAMPVNEKEEQWSIAYIGGSRMGESYPSREKAEAELREVFPGRSDLEVRQGGSFDPKEKSEYTSSHFTDVPNYVAHMRTNERVDADGQPGLFIEEIQSDRHQAGRKSGYKEDVAEALRISQKYAPGMTMAMSSSALEAMGASKADIDFVKKVEGGKNETSDAPFRTTWPLQMFKRALRDAVESGKSWIGWTNGETQNERFDLSKSVSKLSYHPETKALTGADLNGATVIRETVEPEKLEEYVGKDVAKRLLAAPRAEVWSRDPKWGGSVKTLGSHSLEGDDLKVGGSGMKGFYDNMLPKEIGKYVKQWGATVEKSAVLTQNSLEQKAFPNRKFDPDTPIWRVNITPAMQKSVSTKGQPMYSKEAPEEPEDAKPRKSEMAARQLTQLAPNEVNRITKAAVSPMRNSQGNEQAIEEAAAMFKAIGKAGGWEPHLAQLQSVIERYQQTPSGMNSEDIRSSEGQFVHDATPALYFGMMLKSLRKAVNSSQSTPRQKRAAISAMAKAGEIMANPAARAGRTLQGFAAAYRAITFPELHVEVIARNLLHGSDKNADLFNQEFAPIMDRLYKEFGDVFSEAAADPAKQERLLEKLRNAVGSSIAADDIADHTEAEMDLALNLSDLVFDELESWSGKAGKTYAEWRDILADKQILAMMDSEAKMSKGLSSAEVQLRRERLLKEMGGTASKKAISELLATKTAREVELVAEMEKAFGNVRKPKTTVAPAAAGASKIDKGAATVAAAIQRVLSAPTKTSEESGDAAWNILIAAIVRQMKSGIPKTTTAVKADKAVALAAMVSSPTDAAAVRKAAGDLLQKWAEENEGSFDKAAFDAALKTMVGSTFEADGEHQPFTAKDAQGVIKDELETLKIDVRKIVLDGRLTNAAIDSVVKSVRERLALRYGGPTVLDRVEAVLRTEWGRSLAERIKRIDETDRSRAQRKADEFMKRVDNAGYEADEKRRADAARKEREASAADIREARAEQRGKARMNALRLKPLAAAEGVRAGRMKGEDALSFLARRFGFRSETGKPRVPGEPVFSLKEFLSTLDENVRKDGVEDMLHKVADYLGYDRYQTERFVAPVLSAAMSQIDSARAEKLKKIFEPDAKKRKARESEIEKHVRLIKMGALDQEAYANILLGARGKKGMTPEFKAMLTDLIRRRDMADEGSPQRLDIEREIAQAVSAARGIAVWDYMQNIFGAHIFSGINTQKVNFIFGFVGAQSALLTRARAAANSIEGLSAAEKLKVQAVLFKEGLQGFTNTYARAAGRFTFSTGHSHIDDPTAQFAGSALEASGAFPGAAMTAFGRDLPAWMNPAVKTIKSLTKFHKYVRRTMVGSDLVNRAPVWEAMMGMQALPEAVVLLRKTGQPITQKALEDAIDEVNFGVGGREAAVKAAEGQAAEEQKSGQLANNDVARRERVRQLLQEKLSPLDGMSKAERLEEINNIGRRSTLAYDVPGVLGGLSKMLDNVANFMPLGRQFMAAIKVPIAGLHTAMDYGPWGFLRLVAAKNNGGRASMSLWYQSWRADLNSKLKFPDPDSAILSPVDVEALRIKATYGTAMFGLLAVAIAASLDEDDDKAKWFVTAQGPRDPEERRLWRQRGFNPWSIRIAGQDIGYRETPLFSIIAPLGAMSDAKRYDNGKHWEDVQTRIAATSIMTLRALSDQAALDSMKKLFEATSGGDGDGAEKKFKQAATRIGAAFVAPNLFHDMNDILYGPQDTKNRSWSAAIFANVPFAPSITPSKPVLNVFGETIHEQRKGAVGEVFNSLRYRVATKPVNDPAMHFVAKMDIAKLFTGRRKTDGTLVMDDPSLVYEWGSRAGKMLRKAITPTVISQFEKLKNENNGVALKEFDKFVSSIRTGALNEVLNESDK